MLDFGKDGLPVFRSDLAIAVELFAPVLKPVLKEIVLECMKEISVKTGSEDSNLVTRDQACRVLHVCKSTIINWERSKKITPVTVGRKVCYNICEINKLAGYGNA